MSELQDLALKIKDIVIDKDLDLEVGWIPRCLNEEADSVSRFWDADDGGIQDYIFSFVTTKWGVPVWDAFADENNAKCITFCSLFPSSRTGWRGQCIASPEPWNSQIFAWYVPPVSVIPKLFSWLKSYSMRGIIGMPLWPSHPSFMTVRDHGRWDMGIKDVLIYPPGTKLIIPSPSASRGVYTTEFIHFEFAFFLVDFY